MISIDMIQRHVKGIAKVSNIRKYGLIEASKQDKRSPYFPYDV